MPEPSFHQTVTVIRNTCRLLRRGHILSGLFVLAAALGAILYLTVGNAEVPLDDFPLKVRYAVLGITGVLGLAGVYTAVQTAVADLTGREFHAMDATAVGRTRLWFGRLIGFWLTIVTAFLSALLVIAILAFFDYRSAPVEHQSKFNETFSVTKSYIDPTLPDFDRLAREEFRQLQEKERVPDPSQELTILYSLRKKLRSDYEYVATNGVNAWDYSLDHYRSGTPLSLHFSCTGVERYTRISGELTLLGTDGGILWGTTVSAFPYTETVIDIPPSRIPPDMARLTVQFQGVGNQPLMFTGDHHLRLSHPDGSIVLNLLSGIGLHLFWLFTLTALAMTVSAALSFHPAVLCALLLFLSGFCSPYIRYVTDDWAQEFNNTAGDWFWINVVNVLSMTFSTFAPPQVIGTLVSGTTLSVATFEPWLICSAMTLVILFAVGIFAIHRRELARNGDES